MPPKLGGDSPQQINWLVILVPLAETPRRKDLASSKFDCRHPFRDVNLNFGPQNFMFKFEVTNPF